MYFLDQLNSSFGMIQKMKRPSGAVLPRYIRWGKENLEKEHQVFLHEPQYDWVSLSSEDSLHHWAKMLPETAPGRMLLVRFDSSFRILSGVSRTHRIIVTLATESQRRIRTLSVSKLDARRGSGRGIQLYYLLYLCSARRGSGHGNHPARRPDCVLCHLCCGL